MSFTNWELNESPRPPRRFDSLVVRLVAPARRSPAALANASRRHHDDNQVIHSLAIHLDELATLTGNTIVFDGRVRITKLPIPTPLQRKAFELIGAPISLQLKAV
ncbi:MAG: hypothetical protein ACYDEY_11540 [Acidimicrobiales bacterium]